MSDKTPQIEGETVLSPVASPSRAGGSKLRTIAIFGVGTAAIVGAIFWRDARRAEAGTAQAAPMQMGQFASFERYVAPIEPAVVVVPPQPIVASLPQVLREANQTAASAPAAKRMISYGSPTTAAAITPPGAQPNPSDTRTGIAFKAGVIPGTKAGPAVSLTYMLMPGVIKCVLDNAIDTTQPGPIFCHLSETVFSPDLIPLMEAGTKVTGSYTSNMSQGQTRLPAVSGFAITPHGVSVVFGGPMGDALGRSGITGEIDTHFLDKFGGALLLMTAQGVMSAATSALQHGNGNSSVNLNTGQVESAVSEVLRNTINIPPTVRVNQGSEIGLFVTAPVDFRDAYAIREVR